MILPLLSAASMCSSPVTDFSPFSCNTMKRRWMQWKEHNCIHVSPYKQLMMLEGFPAPWSSTAVMIQSVYGVHTVVQGVSPAALSAASVQAEIELDPFYPSEGPHGFCSYLKVHEMQIKYAFVCWLSPGSERLSTYLNVFSLLWEFLHVLSHSLKVPLSRAFCALTDATDYRESCAVDRGAQQYAHENHRIIESFLWEGTLNPLAIGRDIFH